MYFYLWLSFNETFSIIVDTPREWEICMEGIKAIFGLLFLLVPPYSIVPYLILQLAWNTSLINIS